MFISCISSLKSLNISLSAPSLPPENIVSQKINSTSLNIRFGLIPPDDRNGVIAKYLVNIRQLNVDTLWTTYEVVENGQTKSIDIGGLEKWRDYEYTVAGCTLVCGVESPIAIKRTDQDCKKFLLVFSY